MRRDQRQQEVKISIGRLAADRGFAAAPCLPNSVSLLELEYEASKKRSEVSDQSSCAILLDSRTFETRRAHFLSSERIRLFGLSQMQGTATTYEVRRSFLERIKLLPSRLTKNVDGPALSLVEQQLCLYRASRVSTTTHLRSSACANGHSRMKSLTIDGLHKPLQLMTQRCGTNNGRRCGVFRAMNSSGSALEAVLNKEPFLMMPDRD